MPDASTSSTPTDEHFATTVVVGGRDLPLITPRSVAERWIEAYYAVARNPHVGVHAEPLEIIGVSGDFSIVEGYGWPIAHVRGRETGVDFILFRDRGAGYPRVLCEVNSRIGLYLDLFDRA